MKLSAPGFPVPIKISVLALAMILGLAGCHRDDVDAVPAAADPVPEEPATPQTQAITFRIDGTAPGVKDGTKVRLFLASERKRGAKPLLETTVSGNRFSLVGSLQAPQLAMLSIGDKGAHGRRDLVLEDATYDVNVTEADGLRIEGGKYNETVYGYTRLPEYAVAEQHLKQVNRKVFAGLDMEDEGKVKAARQASRVAREQFQKIRDDYQARVLEGDAPVLVKLYVLMDNYDWERYDQDKRKQMYASYAAQLGDHPDMQRMLRYGKAQEERRAVQASVAVGQHYKDVVAWDLDGGPHKLSDVLAGNKLVLLDFWASWCNPCRGEFPHLAKTHKEFNGHGFEIYAVSLDEDKQAWLKALKEERAKNDIGWINLHDEKGVGSAESSNAYGVIGLPSNFLIDAKGTIIGVGLREWDVERVVRDRMGKPENGKASGV